ncbi:MAG: BolA family protein [Stagnimonas sp.]|nr:BolA family protein [Stagnimonas sp.]
MSNSERIARIRAALLDRFTDADILIEDESHLHAGHAGAASGHGHFRLRIVSASFAGLAPIARHRAVYAALGELMKTDIHALSIDAQPPA